MHHWKLVFTSLDFHLPFLILLHMTVGIFNRISAFFSLSFLIRIIEYWDLCKVILRFRWTLLTKSIGCWSSVENQKGKRTKLNKQLTLKQQMIMRWKWWVNIYWTVVHFSYYHLFLCSFCSLNSIYFPFFNSFLFSSLDQGI